METNLGLAVVGPGNTSPSEEPAGNGLFADGGDGGQSVPGTLRPDRPSDDEVFAYVYGVLHSPDFRETFAVNLKKEAPRVPLVKSRADFDAAGQELLELHVG